MKATVEQDLCTGCGICEIVCPEVFEMKPDTGRGVAFVHTQKVPDRFSAFCVDARDCCPTNAIALSQQAGGRLHAGLRV